MTNNEPVDQTVFLALLGSTRERSRAGRLLVLTLTASFVLVSPVSPRVVATSPQAVALSPPTGFSKPVPSVAGELQTYTVVPGDALYELARRQGLAYQAVARANGIADPNIVRVGRALILPTRYILPAFLENGVVVNVPEYRLYLFRGGTLQAVYPAAVGLPTWQTPIGSFAITCRVQNPAWYMPPDLARRENVKREVVAPGPDNPLGDFWIGTSLKHTGLHSTNCPMTVGRALSHGCLRLYPEHAKALFWEVTVGEAGEIVYEPVKVAVDGDDILVEIHPDVYGLVPDLAREAEERLRAMDVWEKVDVRRLRQAVAEARGIPVTVRTK
jgi:L,D-transpeptidase ErfK/SrfK